MQCITDIIKKITKDEERKCEKSEKIKNEVKKITQERINKKYLTNHADYTKRLSYNKKS